MSQSFLAKPATMRVSDGLFQESFLYGLKPTIGSPSRLTCQKSRPGVNRVAARLVLRARESPANIHRLCEIRDAANNMPAVNAVKALMFDEYEQINRPNTPTPGISIRIVQVSSPPAPIDIKAAPRIIDASE
jgi:hypothetical protein